METSGGWGVGHGVNRPEEGATTVESQIGRAERAREAGSGLPPHASPAELAVSAERLEQCLHGLRDSMERATRELARATAESAAVARTARRWADAAGCLPTSPGLTRREAQVTGLAALGHTNAEIARALHLGRETVKSHLTSAFRKLGVRSRRELQSHLSAPPPEWGSCWPRVP